MRSRTRLALLLPVWVIGAGLLACGDPLEPEFRRVLATIRLPDQPVQIDMPDTVQANAPFVLSVQTYGNACREAGDTEVSGGSGSPLLVRPYDRALRVSACQPVLRVFDHSVQLTIAQTGTNTIEVRGIAGQLDGTSDTISVFRQVFVE